VLLSWDQVLKDTYKTNVGLLLEFFPNVLEETCEPLLKHLDDDVVEAACWLKKRGWKLNPAGTRWLKENLKLRQGIFYKEIYNYVFLNIYIFIVTYQYVTCHTQISSFLRFLLYHHLHKIRSSVF